MSPYSACADYSFLIQWHSWEPGLLGLADLQFFLCVSCLFFSFHDKMSSLYFFFFFYTESRCCRLVQLLLFFLYTTVFLQLLPGIQPTEPSLRKEIVGQNQSLCTFHASSLFLSVNGKLFKQTHLICYL